jgi:ATP-dependent DNA helicase RecG
VKHLRRVGLIEGRKPNLYVSASIAKATDNKATYIRMRAQNDDYYAKLIIDYLTKFGSASRADIEDLILVKLSEALDLGQKKNKISNLLTNMRRAGKIRNSGPRKAPKWELAG